jgi:hypothetical protein
LLAISSVVVRAPGPAGVLLHHDQTARIVLAEDSKTAEQTADVLRRQATIAKQSSNHGELRGILERAHREQSAVPQWVDAGVRGFLQYFGTRARKVCPGAWAVIEQDFRGIRLQPDQFRKKQDVLGNRSPLSGEDWLQFKLPELFTR